MGLQDTKEMTTRQFHAWLDAGKPPLEPPTARAIDNRNGEKRE